jgi:hypothetical protein
MYNNKPVDWLERNAIGLEKIKEKLQQYTFLAEEGVSFDMELRHNFQQRVEEECVIWHHHSIDPYWEQLTTAIQMAVSIQSSLQM